MELKLERYLSTDRLRTSSQTSRTPFEESLSDKARIVTSTAFRRLQTKAQVFSLERNAAVRSRLTHTLEVAMYGQLMAGQVAESVLRVDSALPSVGSHLATCVENACLLHDIGNPPFGHLGEFAIRTWFASRRDFFAGQWRDRDIPATEATSYLDAYSAFDGNPQGFRIVTRLLWLRDHYGLNLTTSLLAAMVKYPYAITGSHPFAKKIGYFPSEAETLSQVWASASLLPGQRHPLAFIMEAADDIAYCVSDIEDAIEKRILTEGVFFSALPDDVRQAFDGHGEGKEGNASSTARFVEFRIKLTRHLVATASRVFAENYLDILAGRFEKPLLDSDAQCCAALEALKAFARERIFVSREAVNIELGGYRIVQELLDQFVPLLKLPKNEFDSVLPGSKQPPKYGKLALELRLASLLPGRHLHAYRHAVGERPTHEAIFRMQAVVDYVSGMTDSHALQIYRMLAGTSDGAQP